MFVITKLLTTERLYGTRRVFHIARFYTTQEVVGASATLYDTKSKSSSAVKVSSFKDLVDALQAKSPYGMMPYTFDGNLGYRLFVTPKLSLSFLDYVDSVDIVRKSECSVDLSPLEDDNKIGLLLLDSLGSYNTFFKATFEPYPGYGFDEVFISIFDAVCLLPSSFIDGNFYLPIKPPPEHAFDVPPDSWICKVTCNNPAKIEALIARSNILRPDLAVKLFDNDADWGY